MPNEEKPLKEPPFLKRIKLLDEKVIGLEGKIDEILKRMENVVEPHKIIPETPKSDSTTFQGPQEGTQIIYPVPFEYREIINTVLNGQFGIKIEPMPDRPAFQLQIIVPEKYSNMSLDEKKMYKVDIRTKIITYAEGPNGIRQYAELVANNLGPERRAQIITDRAQLQ